VTIQGVLGLYAILPLHTKTRICIWMKLASLPTHISFLYEHSDRFHEPVYEVRLRIPFLPGALSLGVGGSRDGDVEGSMCERKFENLSHV
jgi:hypothetical protein